MISLTDLQISHYARYGTALPASGSILTTPEGEITQGYLAFLRLGRGIQITRTKRILHDGEQNRQRNVYVISYPDPTTH